MNRQKNSSKNNNEKEKSLLHHEVEQVLLPRLKKMGFLLLFFGLITFAYEIFDLTMATASQEEEILTAVLQKPNYYLFTAIFGGIGSLLLFVVWRKRK